jgi:hypothetical protein
VSVESHVTKVVHAELGLLEMIAVVETFGKLAELNLQGKLVDHRVTSPNEIREILEVLELLVKPDIHVIQISHAHQVEHETLVAREVRVKQLNHELLVEQSKHASLEVLVHQAERVILVNLAAHVTLGVFAISVLLRRSTQRNQLVLRVSVRGNLDQRIKKQFAREMHFLSAKSSILEESY